MIQKGITFIAALVIFISSTSYHLHEPGNQGNFNYKPVKKFDWLTDFYVISQCLSQDHFEKTKGRSFDSIGCYMSDGKYHPVNLFQYGIFCFDMYRETNDEKFKTKCINQFKYFLDTANYTTRADGAIGFPYKITFRDLKPLWYSGLAQAEGIMYLIRYYYLTGDERAVTLIQQVKNFMLDEVSCEGTLNIISADEYWIEEYVKSKSKSQVLNGFVTSIIGLHEYCQLFPDDKEAKFILDKCISTHKKWVHKYDLGNGLLYDLGEKGGINAFYMKIQVVQMRYLFDLFKDIFYKDLEMLWATYAFSKPISGITGCLLNDTNYSTPVALNSENWAEASVYNSDLLTEKDFIEIKLAPGMNSTGIKNMTDASITTFFTLRNNDSVQPPPFIHFVFAKPFPADAIYIIPQKDSLDFAGYLFYSRKTALDNWKAIKIKTVKNNEKKFIFNFNETEFSEFKIAFNSMNRKQAVGIGKINFTKTGRKNSLAYYSHYVTSDFTLEEKGNRFVFEKKDIDDFVIFYRTGNSATELAKAKWNIYKGIRKTNFSIDDGGKLCRFLVVFKNKTLHSAGRLKKVS